MEGCIFLLWASTVLELVFLVLALELVYGATLIIFLIVMILIFSILVSFFRTCFIFWKAAKIQHRYKVRLIWSKHWSISDGLERVIGMEAVMILVVKLRTAPFLLIMFTLFLL